jgi:hypothetical protein
MKFLPSIVVAMAFVPFAAVGAAVLLLIISAGLQGVRVSAGEVASPSRGVLNAACAICVGGAMVAVFSGHFGSAVAVGGFTLTCAIAVWRQRNEASSSRSTKRA